MRVHEHIKIERVSWVTTGEAAEALGLHEETIREMLRDGRLEGIKVGTAQQHRWRVPITSIEKLARRRLEAERDHRRKAELEPEAVAV